MKKQSLLLLLTLVSVSACGPNESSQPLSQDNSVEVDESIYEGYDRVVGWPGASVSNFLSDFSITDSVPAPSFTGSYWYAEVSHPDYGEYFEVFAKQTEEDLTAYVALLNEPDWFVEDSSDQDGPYFIAVNEAETIELHVYYYYEDEDGYPDSVTWVILPLFEEETPEENADYKTSTVWPGSDLASFFESFDISDSVPAHSYTGNYWYGEFEDEDGPYFEIYNEEPQTAVTTYKDLLVAANWDVKDFSDDYGPYFVAVNPSETILIEFYNFEAFEDFAAGVAWYFYPLEASGESVLIAFAESASIRAAVTDGFEWTTSTGFKVTHTKGESGNAPAATAELRLYQLNELSFKAPTGYVITSVVLTADGANNGPVLGTATVNGGSIHVDGVTYTITANAGVSEVSLTAGSGKQTRLLSVEIFFAAKQ